jgi:hypothetical protein
VGNTEERRGPSDRDERDQSMGYPIQREDKVDAPRANGGVGHLETLRSHSILDEHPAAPLVDGVRASGAIVGAIPCPPQKTPSGLSSKTACLRLSPQRPTPRLLLHLETLARGLKDILYEPNEPVRLVYFPLNRVTSLLSLMDDGQAVEVGTIGNEGMVRLPVFLGAESMPGRAFSQVPREALRMAVEVFKAEALPEGHLRALLHRYTQAFMVQLSQSATCNRLHTVAQRCARWLLMTHDRGGIDQFSQTQEFLA